MKIESVFVAIPTHSGTVRNEIATALAHWAGDNIQIFPPIGDIYFLQGISNLPVARDMLAARFLDSKCTHSLWIDDDMAPTWPHIMRLLYTAQRADSDFLSGACYMKAPKPRQAFKLSSEIQTIDGGTLNGASHVGLAFALVSRSAFERIGSHCPQYELQFVNDHGQADKLRLTGFFQLDPGVGEDIMFCRRARAAGMKILVDTGCVVPHVGPCRYPITPEGEDIFNPLRSDQSTTAPARLRAHSQANPPPFSRVARNAPCPCGSGKKFKRCCDKEYPRTPAAAA